MIIGKSHQIFEYFEQNIENFVRQQGWIRPVELKDWQKEWIEKLNKQLSKYLSKYSRTCPALDEEKIFLAENMEQYGIGSLDYFLGNNIYLSFNSLEKLNFQITLAHEYIHNICIKNFLNSNTDGLFYCQTKINKPGYELLYEGVTDLFTMLTIYEMGYDIQDNVLCLQYKPYREIIYKITKNIGQGNFRQGFEYFIQSYITGNDEILKENINKAYKNTGGYSHFIDLLNDIQGFSGDINRLETNLKNKLKTFASYYGLNIFGLEKDRHFKKLKLWATGGKI